MHDRRWLSRFHSDERQVPRYRAGWVFLVGNAAHSHPPAAGRAAALRAALVAWCGPPTRQPAYAGELRLAAQRAADAEQARQRAHREREAAADEVDVLQGAAAAPTTPPAAERAGGTGGWRRERRGRGQRAHRRGDLERRPITADERRRADPERLLGIEPRRDTPGRRRDWRTARAALESLVDLGRYRDHRDLRHSHRERPGRTVGRDRGRQERDGR